MMLGRLICVLLAVCTLAANAKIIAIDPRDEAHKIKSTRSLLDIDKSVNLMTVEWLGDATKTSPTSIVAVTEHTATSDSILFVSTDQGQTFDKYDLKEPALLAEIFKNEAFPSHAILMSKEKKTLFFTQDGGVHWASSPFKAPIKENGIIFSDFDPQLVLFLADSGQLYGTRDFGKTIIDSKLSNVLSAHWGNTKHFSSNTVFAVQQLSVKNKTTAMLQLSLTEKKEFHREPLPETSPPAFAYEILDTYFFKTVADLNAFSCDLFISEDAKNWRKTQFPITLPLYLDEQNVPFPGLEIITTHGGAVYVKILTSAYSSEPGNLYVSDPSGVFYSLALERNMHYASNYSDFTQIPAIPGVFLTNQLPHTAEKTDYARTLISFDAASKWSPLTPPDFDSNGSEIEVCDFCYLHLHNQLTEKLTMNQIQATYLDKHSPGLIISNGVVGRGLDLKQTNLYLSQNAGASWREVLKGPHRFAVGDRGGLLVAIDSAASVQTQILVSHDFGDNWYTFEFSKDPTAIIRILGKPGFYTREFTIWGIDKNGDWVVYALDFSDFLDRDCVFSPSDSSSSQSDYFTWSPSDGRLDHERCILGATYTYYRRKHNSRCRNVIDSQATVGSEPCKCTAEDYQCAYGFMRPNLSAECYPDPSFIHKEDNMAECLQRGAEFFTVPSAYRKIPSDICQGGVDGSLPYTSSHTLPCPKYHGSPSKNAFAKLMLFVSLGGLVMSIYLAFSAYRRKQDYWKRKYIALAQQEDANNELGFGSGDDDEDEEEEDGTLMIGRRKNQAKRARVVPTASTSQTNNIGFGFHDDDDEEMMHV